MLLLSAGQIEFDPDGLHETGMITKLCRPCTVQQLHAPLQNMIVVSPLNGTSCRKHNGDEDAVLNLIMEAVGDGGVSNYLKLMDGLQDTPTPMQPIADACDRFASRLLQHLLVITFGWSHLLAQRPDLTAT